MRKNHDQIKMVLLGAIIALCVAHGARADTLEDGIAAYNRGDFATAVRLLRPLAARENAAAQATLGVMYYSQSKQIVEGLWSGVIVSKYFIVTSAHKFKGRKFGKETLKNSTLEYQHCRGVEYWLGVAAFLDDAKRWFNELEAQNRRR